MALEPHNADPAKDSPQPELNPLLNPVLGRHMERWAEVYFASPPANRDQAVRALLRELEAEPDAGKEASQKNSVTEELTGTNPRRASLFISPPKIVLCPSCRRENPASHLYCGMCGAPLSTNALAKDQRVTDRRQVNAGETASVPDSDPFGPGRSAEDRASLLSLYKSGPELAAELAAHESRSADFEAERTLPDREIFLKIARPLPRETPPGLFATLSSRNDRSYRVYLGTALIILLPMVVFAAWPSAQTKAKTSAPAQSSAANSGLGNLPAPSPDKAAQSVPAAENDRKPGGQQTPTAIPMQPASTVATESSASSQLAPANGSEELATALNYLNGSGGKERDPEQAAQWLWKAVAKRNGDATLRLSDMYLKGEGVARNCDQARVLLKAAASRGISGAGERLRDLPSLGCE